MKDDVGFELKVGDYVYYQTNNRVKFGKVVGFTPMMVRVDRYLRGWKQSLNSVNSGYMLKPLLVHTYAIYKVSKDYVKQVQENLS